MKIKFRTLAGVVLVTLILFTTCKTSDNRSREAYNKDTFQETDKLSLAWITGREVKLDTLVAKKKAGVWSEEMNRFYASRKYKAAWLTNQQLNKNGEELFSVMNSIWEDGLSAEAYNFSSLKSKLKKYEKLTAQEKDSLSYVTILDIELTRAFFNLANDVANGRVDPSLLETVWQTYPKQDNLAAYLSKAVNNKEVESSIEGLKPKSEQYKLLKRYYVSLLEVQEKQNWPVPGYFTEKLEENDSSEQVINVKRFLAATGDLQNIDTTYLRSKLYDGELAEAVQNFQERHGLEADGIIGRATVAEMNQPLEKRISQIRVNLDRMRSLPNDLGDEYIAVNIPGFSLKYVKHNKLVNEMNVVVGSNKHATPVLKDTLSYIVFNPEWNVPNSIATNEILPKIKKDSSYLARNNYKVVPYAGSSKNIDWSAVSPSKFPYRIVQKSGGSNALGIVKFIMPNRYNIYLHDTPSKKLFSRAKRNFSHGCIRLAEPVKLAEDILAGQLSPGEIEEVLASHETKKVVLKERIPVHMFYQTAWVDEDGKLQFREDIYKHDPLALAQIQKFDSKSEHQLLFAESK